MESNESVRQYQEEWLLANYLIKMVTEKASGVLDTECYYNYPRDIYFIGNLRPRDEHELSLSRADLMQKLSPSAFGAEFKLRAIGNEILIEIEISWNCFYRVFPTYSQQIEWMRALVNNETKIEGDTTEKTTIIQEEGGDSDDSVSVSKIDRQKERKPREDLFIRFKKLHCSSSGKVLLKKGETNEWSVDTTDLENNIQLVLNDALSKIRQDDERLRLKSMHQLFTLKAEDLQSEEAYNQFLQSLRVEVNNFWSWEISKEITSYPNNPNEINLLLQFVNSTHFEEKDKSIEPYIFNSKVKFIFSEEIVFPFELELAPKSFRYDRFLWGKGFNCGIDKIENSYITTHTPIYTQLRYQTRDEPSAKFEDLSNNPAPILKSILDSMILYIDKWANQEKEFENEYGSIWKQYIEEYRLDKSNFEKEINRFGQGVSLIESDPDIKLAFQLANESFRRAGLGKEGNIKKDRWRLFQIVFMVSQIPGIAALNPLYGHYQNEREFVDIIYFPTGGGKTEAYLAVLLFHCFYDRLRGKIGGVTSWIRFPLRLLTLQQTQRLADIVGIAEIVRKEQLDKRLNGKDIDSFAVGYYVGGGEGSTPNEIKPPQNGRPEPTWSMALDKIERQRWKRVVTCPSCKTNTVSVEFDETRIKIYHKCNNSNCKFENGVIPVYVIDNEIYRYLPSVMVGTIDKLAGIGNQRKLSLIFGKVDGYCTIHGYFNGICCQKGCVDRNRLVRLPSSEISGPTLFLQDELHLLKEGLGTFDSHYETFTQYLLKEAGAKNFLKIIASSATIEKYERQVEHLYGRNPNKARVFPGKGPTLKESFYAQTEDYPQRIFVGILPHNKTIFNAILEIIEYYHRIVQHLTNETGNSNPFTGKIKPGTDEWNKLLNFYYTSLTYFLSSRDLDSIKTDIESHINNVIFTNEGLNTLEVKELTGGTSTDEVSRILEKLEAFHGPNQPNEAVLATNMISHGVDIDRFNCMIFYGIPRQNAEYIQASSRVGRSHVGIIFNCFPPIRERDQSHYSYFTKYHEFLGQMVEPVAINRWSSFGIDKTLPGLFMGVMLQILSNRDLTGNRNSYYMLNKISQMYQANQIDKNEIKKILKEAFTAGLDNDDRNTKVKQRIDEAVDYYFRLISNAGSNESFLSDALHPKPMRSLRDIDDVIEIELDRLGENWVNSN